MKSASSASGTSRNYPLLLAGQFLGAFGDNAILAVIVGQLTWLHQAGSITEGALRTASTFYTSLLFIPYVLLAPFAGYLNDRHAKTRWLVGGNGLKIIGTLLCAVSIRGVAGEAGEAGGAFWQGIGYLVVGIGACVYGPAKYGILPEILPRERLVKANGTVELLTLVAILSGAIAGARLSDAFRDNVLVSFGILAAIYGGALLFSLAMRPTPADPGVRLGASIGEFGRHTRDLCASPRLRKMLLGTALFWVCGATMKINFQPWGIQVLGLENNTQIALLGLWLSVGVMIGSILAGQLHKVGDLRAAPHYGFGLAVMLALLFSVESFGVFWRGPVFHVASVNIIVPVTFLLIATGIVAGLFLIPLNAALQAESDPARLGKTIAVQNLFDNIGMCIAGAYTFIAVKAGMSASGVFLGLAAAIAVIALLMRQRKPAPPPARYHSRMISPTPTHKP
ncbi:MAG: MFS transporter [Opitutaceae bacterium]|jgi:LPLT family lysophospholipid transporter-like MFS transporter|nr:MFS transporter [Opitutaceae bacterium]